MFYPPPSPLLSSSFSFCRCLPFAEFRLAALAGRIQALAWPGLALLGCVLLTLQLIAMPFGFAPDSVIHRTWMSYSSLGAIPDRLLRRDLAGYQAAAGGPADPWASCRSASTLSRSRWF